MMESFAEALVSVVHMNHNLNSLKGGYIGDYYRGY